jgi:hypothetical protein
MGPKTTIWDARKPHSLPYGVRLRQTKLQMAALPPSKCKFSIKVNIMSADFHEKSAVIQAFIQPIRVLISVSKSATFPRG